MFYKGIIFDLDNTLYNYDDCHLTALNKVLLFIIDNNSIDYTIEDIKNMYENISKKIKCELNGTASSHNKSINFKKLLEYLKINASILTEINKIYWNTFYQSMVCFEGIKEFILWNKKIGIKIGILTDYETEYQVEKLIKLNLIFELYSSI